MPRVFISSTSVDLEAFRFVARAAIDNSQWDVEWMERFGSGTQATVDDCRAKVLNCDLLLLIVAYRYGSRPPGSDKSYTLHEVETALAHGIPVRALMAKPSWPGDRYEQDPENRQRIIEFRDSWNAIAEFFEDEPVLADGRNPLPHFGQLVRKVMNDHREWVHGLRRQLSLEPHHHISTAGFSISQVLSRLSALHDGRVLAPMTLIRRAYQSCHPAGEGLPADRDSVTTFVKAVATLAQLPGNARGSHPLQSFLLQLAVNSGGEHGLLLQGCLGGESAVVLPQPIDPLPNKPAPSTAAPDECRVVLRLESANQQEDGFLATAWIHQGQDFVRLPLEHETWTRQNRAECLHSLHEEVLRHDPPFGRTVFEFVVSRKMINEDFDQWEMAVANLGYMGRLVDEFPIVVRSLEREQSAIAAHKLKWRWEYV